MDPTRFHQQFAEDLRHQAGTYGMTGGGWPTDPSKASSAFSPINTGVLGGSVSSSGFNMGTGARGYPFHDPLSFPRQNQVGKDNKGISHVIFPCQYHIFSRLDLSPKQQGQI